MIESKTLIQPIVFEKKLMNKAFIESYLEDMKEIVNRLDREKIDRIIDLLFSAWKEGKTVFVMGNGGSASTATHLACDLAKCTIVEGKKRFRVICLNDNIPLMSALINDNGFDNLFSEQLKNLMQKNDYLIGFSVHGGEGKDKAGLWSQNLLKAMHLAKEEYQATLIGFSGFDGGAMKDMADECLVIPFNSTPQVESFHLAMEHLICNCLKKKIEEYE
jgi:D-sedoheptulose 7-phosphate isomerase